MRKKFGNKGFPDGIIYKGKEAKTIIEFKLTKQGDTLKRSLCQMLCYISNKYGHGIVPIRTLVVWTEKEVWIFSWESLELLYENFILHYNGSTPTSYWDNCSWQCRKLFTDIDKLAEIIDITTLDFNNITKKLVA